MNKAEAWARRAIETKPKLMVESPSGERKVIAEFWVVSGPEVYTPELHLYVSSVPMEVARRLAEFILDNLMDEPRV